MNTLALMAFGTGVENMLGTRKMFIVYMLTGIVAIFAQYAFSYQSNDVVVGASGAISGLFGAIVYITKKQYGKQFNLSLIIFIWIIFSILQAVFYGARENASVAFIAHIAGFFAGIGITFIMFKLQKAKS